MPLRRSVYLVLVISLFLQVFCAASSGGANPATEGQSQKAAQPGAADVSKALAPALTVATRNFSNAIHGTSYSAPLVGSGGAPPYLWSIQSGTLPVGLKLQADGSIAGTPTSTGPVSFTIRLTDSASNFVDATRAINVLPERPRVSLDTTLPVQTGPVVTVRANQDLQAAMNAAVCGSTIKLQAGATFKGTVFFPKKPCSATKWIVITTTATTLPAEGVRVTPNDSEKMPKIVTERVDSPALDFSSRNGAPGASFYRIIGLEVTLGGLALSKPFNSALVSIGTNEPTPSLMPHDIVIDRCYVHGTVAGEARRGVLMNGVRVSVINSNVSEIHQIANDSQAIAGWNGPGPYKIVNNRLEASSENLSFGGSLGAALDNVPSDIEIRQNYFMKPLSWKQGNPSFGGKAWLVKNLIELKNAARVLVSGNIFENSWAMGQVGFAVLLTPRGPGSQQGGPSTAVSEITFAQNVFLHVGGGFNISADDSEEASPRPLRGGNIALLDNVVLDAKGGSSSPGSVVQLLNGVPNFTFQNNTGFGSAVAIVTSLSMHSTVPNRPNAPSWIKDNILNHGSYGLFCGNNGIGKPAMEKCFGAALSTFANNLLIGLPPSVKASDYPTSNLTCNLSNTTCYPADFNAAGIIDPASCNASDFDFTKCALKESSPYRRAGSEGRDLGADITALSAVVAGVKP